MAVTIDGVWARAIGVAAGLAFLVPAVGMWLVLGAVAANVPLPPGVEQSVESMVPVLQPAAPGVTDAILPLGVLVPAAFFLLAFSLAGLVVTLRALLRPEYTVDLRGGSP